jgi:hypothetical protein
LPGTRYQQRDCIWPAGRPPSLELGGNNALIILDDADLEVASSSGAWSAFLHQGQICMTAGRHIVAEAVADEYLNRLAKRAGCLQVANPYTEQAALGSLINARQTVQEQAEGIFSGALPSPGRIGTGSRCGTLGDSPFWRVAGLSDSRSSSVGRVVGARRNDAAGAARFARGTECEMEVPGRVPACGVVPRWQQQ